MKRAGFLTAALLVVVSMVLVGSLTATPPDQDGKPDEVDDTVDRAVAYLLRIQHRDGAIADNYPRNATAMTSLSLLAMAGVGHLPSDPTPEGRAMRRALDFVLGEGRQDPAGYFGQADGSRMYGHGITTLMLAEFMGMGVDARQDELIRQRLEKAIDLILRAQNVRGKQPAHRGGWRYTPESTDSDLSVSVWQLMSLRSAKNAGLDVPDKAIEDAIAYLRRSYGTMARRGDEALGGFSYQPTRNPSQNLFSPHAMGLLSMQVVGQYEAPEVQATANFLRRSPPESRSAWLFYGLYYYAQGMYQYAEGIRQAGDRAQGDALAAESFRIVRDLLLPMQDLRGTVQTNSDYGSWESPVGSERSAGRVYSTSLAILSLSVKYHYLPIYQR
ncbi:MAG: terpene cyclase/mutase family protein [Phycisphaeraceae bacterium]|nr:terpene cyclase/mutase family protein [Phycisphaeraceae bacterium]